MLLVLDNYDSFTFNLVQYLGELASHHPLAADLRVERNDALDVEQIRALNPAAILISPSRSRPPSPAKRTARWCFQPSWPPTSPGRSPEAQ